MKYKLVGGRWISNSPLDGDDDEDNDDDKTEDETMGQEEFEIPQKATFSQAPRRSRAIPDTTPNVTMLQAIQGLSVKIQTISVIMNKRFDHIEDRQRGHEAAFFHYHPDYGISSMYTMSGQPRMASMALRPLRQDK